jgi:hypothetical protein
VGGDQRGEGGIALRGFGHDAGIGSTTAESRTSAGANQLLPTFAGPARAGVVGWWTVPAVAAGHAGLLLMPYDTPILPAVGTLPLLAVVALAGRPVLGRTGADAYEAAPTLVS